MRRGISLARSGGKPLFETDLAELRIVVGNERTIFEPGANESLTATNVSRTLITLDMKTQLQETWKNATLQDDVPGRANPELVWVPVGEQGILVALGGVVHPDFIGFLAKSDDEAASVGPWSFDV